MRCAGREDGTWSRKRCRRPRPLRPPSPVRDGGAGGGSSRFGIVLLSLVIEPGGQWPDRALGSGRAAVRRLRPRDAGAGRLDLPDVQRRAALSQADPDLLADGPGNGPGRRQSRLARGWFLRSPGAATVLASGGWAGGCSARAAGGWPRLILATAPIVIAESKLATTDATLALWLFGCQVCLWVLGRRPSRSAAALFWVLLEPGDLDQGPGRTGLDRGRHRSWPGGGAGPPRPGNGCTGGGDLIGFAILTAPWFVAISIASGGEFLRFAVGRQIVHRVASDMEAHGGFPGYYPVVSALVFYPGRRWCRRPSPAPGCAASPIRNLGFLLGWAIGPLLLLECFRTKLIHYYLPAFPACALLVAWLVLSVTAEGVNIRRRPLGRLAMALLVGIGLAGTSCSWSRGRRWWPASLRPPHAPGRRAHGGRHARRHVVLSARSDRAGGLLAGRDLGRRDAHGHAAG